MENTYLLIVLCLMASILIMGLLFILASIRVVQADKRLSVYRLGQYIGDKGPGIVILIPFIDRGVLKEVGAPEKSPSRDGSGADRWEES